MYRYQLYSATAKGKAHRENQDSAISRVIPWPGPPGNIYLAGVADGVTLTPFGGWVARWIARRLMQDPVFAAGGGPLAEQLAAYLKGAHQAFLAEFSRNEDMLCSASTLSLAAIQGNCAACFWVGDSPIYLTTRVAKAFATRRVSFPDVHPRLMSLTATFSGDVFAPHHEPIQMKKGDVLTLATDGLIQGEARINELYTLQGVSQRTVDTMIAESVPFRHSDDCTISVAHRLA